MPTKSSTSTSDSTITGVVVATRRAGTSSMGNPSFDVTIRPTDEHGTPMTQGRLLLGQPVALSYLDRTLRTTANAGLSYGIQNPEYRDTPHTFGITRAGRLDGTAKVVQGDEYAVGQAVEVRYSKGAQWQSATYISHEGENRHTVSVEGATGYNIADINIRKARA